MVSKDEAILMLKERIDTYKKLRNEMYDNGSHQVVEYYTKVIEVYNMSIHALKEIDHLKAQIREYRENWRPWIPENY